MSQTRGTLDRILAVVLSLLLLCSMMPISYAVADADSVLETNLQDLYFIVGQTTEFTVTSTANEDAGTMVKGHFTFSDPSAIAKLEYYETYPGMEGWYELNGEFGPATGFPVIDGTSTFRVTFATVGDYAVEIALKDITTGDVVCSTSANVTVHRDASILSTDIGDKEFVAYEATEFISH